MSWQMPEADTPAQEAARVAQAEAEERRVMIRALREALNNTRSMQADRARLRRLLAADLGRWSRDDQRDLDRLAWRHRRRLPHYLAPRLNPDDPIVREMAHDTA
jgi:hypothetical protein